MATLTERMLGAALLERTTYEEVERDRTATAQALGVVVLSSVAAGIGLGAGLSLAAPCPRRVPHRLGPSGRRLLGPAADARVESRRDGGPGTLRAAERLHGRPALAAVLRRVLGGAHSDPGHLLRRAHLRRHHPVRHRRGAARGAGPHAQRPVRA